MNRRWRNLGKQFLALLLRCLVALTLLALLLVTVNCDNDTTNGTTWSGTYTVSDESGGGSGTVSFFVESNDTVYCFKFSGSQSAYSTACNNPATDSFPINGSQFSIPVSSAGGGAFVLEGQFTSSATHATGEIVASPASDNTLPVLSWTAAETGENAI